MFQKVIKPILRLILSLAAPKPKPRRRQTSAFQPKRPLSRKLLLESLEKRDLMAVDIPQVVGKRLVVTADHLDTHVEVRQVGSEVIIRDVGTNQTWNYASSLVASVDFVGGNGNDRFINDITSLPVRAFGGKGNDYLQGNDGADYLDGGGDDDVIIGGGGNDTLVGSAGDDLILGMEGDDRILGGPGDDSLYGNVGDDILQGGSGADLIRGNEGHDSLYGGAGADQLFGDQGDDGLFGGVGELDRLTGGAGEDRFLVDSKPSSSSKSGKGVSIEDSVTDRHVDDSVTHFRNLKQSTPTLPGIGKATFEAGTWTDANIEAIDVALRQMHHITGNTKLLKTASGGDLVFERAGKQLNGLNISESIGGWNSGNGSIAFTNNGLRDQAAALRTTYRMIAQHWDEPRENNHIADFRKTSGWQQAGGAGFTPAKDGSKWHYRTDSVFAHDYGRFNPLEDFATTWESYFDRRFHNNHSQLTHVAAKHAVLDSFFASLRS